MPKLTLDLSDADYKDVCRAFGVKEGSARSVTGVPIPTNAELFAAVCREWEAWNKTKDVMPDPECPVCGGMTVRDSRGYVCVNCGKVHASEEFVPLRMFVAPKLFGDLQDLRKKVGASDIAHLTNIAWSIYGGLVNVEASGGATFVQKKKGDQRSQRLNLYPHKTPAGK